MLIKPIFNASLQPDASHILAGKECKVVEAYQFTLLPNDPTLKYHGKGPHDGLPIGAIVHVFGSYGMVDDSWLHCIRPCGTTCLVPTDCVEVVR